MRGKPSRDFVKGVKLQKRQTLDQPHLVVPTMCMAPCSSVSYWRVELHLTKNGQIIPVEIISSYITHEAEEGIPRGVDADIYPI